MIKKATRLVFIAALLGMANSAYALNNEDVGVRSVDVMDGGRVYIHLAEKIQQRPACAAYESIIGCNLNDEYCKHAMSIALAARMSGSKIDYEIDTTCVGKVARFERLRID